MGHRTLITGALGVVGVWVLRLLAEGPCELLATDLAPDFSLAPELEGAVRFAALDVTDAAAVSSVLADFAPDVVVHLAALMPGAAQADPRRGFEVNVEATATLLEASRAAGASRFVFASSKGVYGGARGPHGHPTYVPLTEDDPCAPATLYDYGKLFCEGLGRAYRETGGPEFAALRFPTIYGPGKLARHGPMAFASRIVEDSLAERPVVLRSGSEQHDQFIYVRDVAAALVAVALHPGTLSSHVYNVDSGPAISVAAYAELARQCLPWSDIQVGPGLDPMGLGIPYYFVLDGSRLRAEVGFTPQYDAERGLRDFVAVELAAH